MSVEISGTPEDSSVQRWKPKLVFFQHQYDARLPEFLIIHKREHVACLAEFFDVATIEQDCDYGEVCEKHRPDLVLFESGVPNPACRRPHITNTRAHQHIPKLGFLHADGFCCARAGFLSDMDHWGIDTFVAIATSAPEHMPFLADRMFIWPNCVDPEIYRNYQQWKAIPVLFTGNKNDIYPWRQKIIRVVARHYPSLMSPHPGYARQKKTGQIPVGESYARLLNAAWFVPACGTVAKEVVRKHFEVPACGSCLVTERSSALEAAGFVDMENCVFADEHDVVDKLDDLFRNPEQLNAIIENGHSLVMSRHTKRHRDQILQWFNLRKGLGSGQKIIQPNPFEPLAVINRANSPKNPYLVSGGHHLELLREGDQHLWAGSYSEAERRYLKCANYIPYMPEPKFRLALCSLYQGRPKAALSWISQPLRFTLSEYKAVDPDPVEWAYLILSLLCLGKTKTAARRARNFESLRHPELDRMRRIVGHIAGSQEFLGATDPSMAKDRLSIHQLPIRSFGEWQKQICIILRACGQNHIVARMVGLPTAPSALLEPSRPNARDTGSNRHTDAAMRRKFQRDLLVRDVASRGRKFVRRVLQDLEQRYRYFLPYHLSAARSDDLYQAIEDLCRDQDIATALVIGATPRAQSVAALMAGLRQNVNRPVAYCISARGAKMRPGTERSHGYGSSAEWYLLARASKVTAASVEETVKNIKRENQIESFDLVLVDGSELRGSAELGGAICKELSAARFVVLDDINLFPAGEAHSILLRDASLAVVGQDIDSRDGFSIFAKRTVQGDTGPELAVF